MKTLHTATLKELSDFQANEWIIFKSSQPPGGLRKRLELSFTGKLRVTKGDAVIYFGTSNSNAVEHYNKL